MTDPQLSFLAQQFVNEFVLNQAHALEQSLSAVLHPSTLEAFDADSATANLLLECVLINPFLLLN